MVECSGQQRDLEVAVEPQSCAFVRLSLCGPVLSSAMRVPRIEACVSGVPVLVSDAWSSDTNARDYVTESVAIRMSIEGETLCIQLGPDGASGDAVQWERCSFGTNTLGELVRIDVAELTPGDLSRVRQRIGRS